MPKELSLASLGIQMPYNMQAEQSVLGAALLDEAVLNRLMGALKPEMFYSDQNRACSSRCLPCSAKTRPWT